MTFDQILSSLVFTEDEWKFGIPAALMAIDFLTGITHAWATGHTKSYKMREGLMKKFAEISILVIGLIFELGFGLPQYILSGFSVYIIFMELISICENLKKMGVPIPKFVEKALASMDKIQKNDLSDKEIEQIIKALKGDKKE